ncbi:hypothetical protein D5086_012777 [Populus alba]|uniref:Uncharacterized protein n=1 Tax=Populus alba TaxID=43335 RepID=A0ACC4C344_POPAL
MESILVPSSLCSWSFHKLPSQGCNAGNHCSSYPSSKPKPHEGLKTSFKIQNSKLNINPVGRLANGPEVGAFS